MSYTLLILIRSTTAGLYGGAADVVDSAVGMGFSSRQVPWHVEVPLAMPVIMAGVRIALISTIGLVTVGSLIGRGGAGQFILEGLRTLFQTEILLGAALAVALGVRRGRRVAPGAASDDALGDGLAREGGCVVSVLQRLLASEHWSVDNCIPFVCSSTSRCASSPSRSRC